MGLACQTHRERKKMEEKIKSLITRLEDCENIGEDLASQVYNLQIDIEENNDEIQAIKKNLEEILKPFQLTK